MTEEIKTILSDALKNAQNLGYTDPKDLALHVRVGLSVHGFEIRRRETLRVSEEPVLVQSKTEDKGFTIPGPRQSTAQYVSEVMGGDGDEFIAPDGRGLATVCSAGLKVKVEGLNGHMDDVKDKSINPSGTRYSFPDGSAIVDRGDAWDVEGSTPWSWAIEE